MLLHAIICLVYAVSKLMLLHAMSVPCVCCVEFDAAHATGKTLLASMFSTKWPRLAQGLVEDSRLFHYVLSSAR